MVSRIAIPILLISAAGLIALGLLTLISIGQVGAATEREAMELAADQLRSVFVAAAACLLFAFVDYRMLGRLHWAGLAFAAVLLALCFVPGVRLEENGAYRWIRLGVLPFTLQPSELAKIAVVAFLAAWYGDPGRWKGRGWWGRTFYEVALPIGTIAIPLALIAFEKDLGTTAMLGATVVTMLFIAGVRTLWIFAGGIAGLAALVFLIHGNEERMHRVEAFTRIWQGNATLADATGENMQQSMGIDGMKAGGSFGVGLGKSLQKVKGLPEQDTDFIFPILAEELGLRVSLPVLVAFVLILLAGMCIALEAQDRFGLLLAAGLVVLISLQAFINIGVATGTLPNKGMALPFVSKGGSNLVFCMSAIGILVSIHRHARRPDEPVRSSVRLRRITPCV